MVPSELSPDSVLREIRSPRKEQCRVWTASTLLQKLGVHIGSTVGEDLARYQALRRRVARILNELWLQGALYRLEAAESFYGLKQVKYTRTENASGIYLVPCERCGGARRCAVHPEGRIVEPCRECELHIFRPEIE